MRRSSALRILCAIAAAVGCTITTALGASATGSVSPVTVGQGSLIVKGVAVSVPVTYTCEGGLAALSLQVRQRVQGGAIATGGQQLDTLYGPPFLPACNGSPQTVRMTLTSGLPFKPGVALALVSLIACDDASFTGCVRIDQEVEFRIGVQ